MKPITIEAGKYLIISFDTENAVGRDYATEEPPYPGAVNQLPPGVRAPVWTLQNSNDGFLITDYNPEDPARTGVVEDRVFVIFEEPPSPEPWYIQHSGRKEPDVFVIKRNNFESNVGWIRDIETPPNEKSQILIGNVTDVPTFPPYYQPYALFRFIPVE